MLDSPPAPPPPPCELDCWRFGGAGGQSARAGKMTWRLPFGAGSAQKKDPKCSSGTGYNSLDIKP